MIWGVSVLLENSVPSPKQPQFSPASAHGSEGGAAGWNIPRLFWGLLRAGTSPSGRGLLTKYCVRSQENIVVFIPSSSPSQ